MTTKGKVVTINYTLKNDSGEVLDQSEDGQPFAYLHGHDQIVPGLERELEGKTSGDKSNVTVTPEHGYGEIREDLRMKLQRSMFPPEQEIEEGMQFAAELTDGNPTVLTITKIDGDDVHVDGNHPLAGETLQFEVEIVEIREATPEELEHGHAHGEGGEHHH